MTTIRFVINTLKPGVDPAAYERWLREYDYPVAKTFPSIVSYRTHRIEGPIHGTDAGWRYIERIEIRDLAQYQKDLGSPCRAGAHPSALRELLRSLEEHLLHDGADRGLASGRISISIAREVSTGRSP